MWFRVKAMESNVSSRFEGFSSHSHTVMQCQPIAAIDNAMNALNAAWQTASQQMYQSAQGAQTGPQDNPFGGQQAQQEAPKDDNIQDADFEEVK